MCFRRKANPEQLSSHDGDANSNQGYESPSVPSGDNDIVYSHATSDDNSKTQEHDDALEYSYATTDGYPQIIHTYLTSDGAGKSRTYQNVK